MNTKVKISLGMLILVLVALGTAIFFTRGSARTHDLTTLSPADAMAYRYTAMAQYYENKAQRSASSHTGQSNTQTGSVPYFQVPGLILTNLSPTDAMAFRYTALAYFYVTHPNATR